MKCEWCDKVFDAKRSTARYCSGACRAKGLRVSARPVLAHALAHGDIKAVIEEAKGQPLDPETEAIWAKHKAQHRPTTYPHKFNDKIGPALPGEPDYEGICYEDEQGVWVC